MRIAPIAAALLALGAVLTTVSALAGCIVAGVGALWQIAVSLLAGVVAGGDEDGERASL